jgi:hypothetical protein
MSCPLVSPQNALHYPHVSTSAQVSVVGSAYSGNLTLVSRGIFSHSPISDFTPSGEGTWMLCSVA